MAVSSTVTEVDGRTNLSKVNASVGLILQYTPAVA